MCPESPLYHFLMADLLYKPILRQSIKVILFFFLRTVESWQEVKIFYEIGRQTSCK